MIGETRKPSEPLHVTIERVLLFSILQVALRKLATLLTDGLLLFVIDCACLFACCTLGSRQAAKNGRSPNVSPLLVWLLSGLLPWISSLLFGFDLFEPWDFGSQLHWIRLTYLAIFCSAVIKFGLASLATLDFNELRDVKNLKFRLND